MTLREYFENFHKHVTGETRGDFTARVAAEVAAAHSIGLSFEQLQKFLARRTEITSVAVALKGATLPVEKVERIIQARNNGAVKPQEVLQHAFSSDEIHEKFLGALSSFPPGDA